MLKFSQHGFEIIRMGCHTYQTLTSVTTSTLLCQYVDINCVMLQDAVFFSFNTSYNLNQKYVILHIQF